MWFKKVLGENTKELKNNASEFQKLAKDLEDETRKAMGWSTRAKIIIGAGIGVGCWGIYHYLL